MQSKSLFKLAFVALTVGLLAAMALLPAAAQGPDDGDVSIQMVDFGGFTWNPAATLVARGDGTVKTKLVITGAQQISGFTLAIGYNASVVKPDTINPGDLLPGTRGVDYFMTVNTGGGALECGGDSSFTVNVAYFDPAKTINGTGALVSILWRSDPDAAVGDVGTICLDGINSLVVDNGGLPSTTPVPNTLGTITIDPANLFKIQIGLEGGKNSGLNVVAVPSLIFTDVTINGIYPCDGGGVNAQGFCAFNNGTVGPPYTVKVSRIGYLDASISFTNPSNASSVWLLAGDLNKDNKVNILDIQLVASLLGSPAGPSTLSQAADYSGPGFAPDGVINIIDLVLVAKNFGLNGPTNGAPPSGGSFPF